MFLRKNRFYRFGMYECVGRTSNGSTGDGAVRRFTYDVPSTIDNGRATDGRNGKEAG